MFLFELTGKVVDDAHVKVFAAEERVTVGGFHFEQPVVDLKDRDVECTAAKVIDRDGLCVLFVQTIGQRRRSWFVDDAQHFKAGNLACVLGRLTLGVVEICRHGDDRLGDLFTQIAFSGFFHLAEDERGDLRRGVFLTLGLDPSVAVAAINDVERQVLLILGQIGVVIATTNQTLDAKDRVIRVCDGLTFGRLADKALVVCERDDGRCRACTFGVFNYARLAAVHDGDAAVGGSKVNTNDF